MLQGGTAFSEASPCAEQDEQSTLSILMEQITVVIEVII